uniref:NADH-ubiquinone oxidoreductase chain 6 n=1 Tax=Pseudoniphargus sp. 1-Murcia TaxID=2212667 RepID=A0A345UE64_9CRUS|nr:NADH dehydrogenase subunit 6 [Pseudoniphargus sp. 1-Murcia]
MTKFLVLLSLMFSVMFLLSTSPLFLSLMIIAQTISLAFIINTITMTSWFSFMLIMIYLSGMMIIFIYISSMASNELFYLNNLLLAGIFLFFIPATLLIFNSTPASSSDYANTLDQNLTQTAIIKTMKMFSKPLFIMTILLIIYLLLAMIVVSKNSSFSSGPLRSIK